MSTLPSSFAIPQTRPSSSITRNNMTMYYIVLFVCALGLLYFGFQYFAQRKQLDQLKQNMFAAPAPHHPHSQPYSPSPTSTSTAPAPPPPPPPPSQSSDTSPPPRLSLNQPILL